MAKTECIGNNLSQINFITIYFKSIVKNYIYTYTHIYIYIIYILYTVKQIIELIYRKKKYQFPNGPVSPTTFFSYYSPLIFIKIELICNILQV